MPGQRASAHKIACVGADGDPRGGVACHPRAEKVAHRQLDIPPSSWARIIGKGGETLKALQREFNVRLHVPRPDAPPGSMVTVRGPRTACEACEERLREMVHEMGRRKLQVKPNKTPQSHSAWPSACALCSCQISSLKTAFDHLASAKHFGAIEERVTEALPLSHPPGQDDILGVVALLEGAQVRELHSELGFDVDELLDAAPVLEQRRLAASALKSDISRLPSCFEWLCIEQRWRSAWDESPRISGETADLLEAPSFDEMSMRCLLDESPPLVRQIGLPVSLPKASHKGYKDRIQKAKHRFPFDPSSRLGVVVLLQQGLALDQIDLVCGTSLIKAFSGDAQRCADTYFLQKFGGALCCLHVTTGFHSQDDAGHAMETLICGSDSKRPRSYYCSSQARIGNRRVLITSEVDGRDENNNLVEIKTSGSKRGASIITASTALQVACNGSGQVLCCGLDAEKTRLLDMQTVLVQHACDRHREAFIGHGQRISFLLERVCSDALFDAYTDASDEFGPVVQLTFDEIKVPVLQPARRDVRVLPVGVPRI